jgi:hypothetical protein
MGMITIFTTTIQKDGEKNATGIQVPEDAIQSLHSGKKPKVRVTLNGYSYRTTVAVMGGVFMIPLSAEHRNAAMVKAGETLDISLELDTEPRTVEIPSDLSAALLETPDGLAVFNKLAFSTQKEYVRQVESAKARDTRDRRIAAIVTKLQSK